MKKILIFLILLLNFSFAQIFDNPAKLENVIGNIPKIKSIKCKFKQEKRLNNISKPIISKGDFEFIENKGVYFNTTYPIESRTDYTNKKYKQINEIIEAVSKKRYSKLEREFDFYYIGNIANWSLGLKPKKNSDSYNFIKSIVIEGKDYINKISIHQINGNSTIIWFIK